MSQSYMMILPPAGVGKPSITVEGPFPQKRGKQVMIYEGPAGQDLRLVVPFPDDFRHGEAEVLAILRRAFRQFSAAAPETRYQRERVETQARVEPVAVMLREEDQAEEKQPRRRRRRRQSTARGWRRLVIPAAYISQGRITGAFKDRMALVRECVKLRNERRTYEQIAEGTGVNVAMAHFIIMQVTKAMDVEEAAVKVDQPRVDAAFSSHQKRAKGYYRSEGELRSIVTSSRRRGLSYGKIARLAGVDRDRVADILLSDAFFDEELIVQSKIRAQTAQGQ